MRVFNFSAGPAMLPQEVLEQAASEMLDYHGTGESVMEMSHRSPEFKAIIEQTEQDFRDLLDVPDNYRVLFMQGGGTQQFACVPLNLMKNHVADYILTGNWSKKAAAEAEKYGKVNIIASSADRNFTYIPDCSDLPVDDDADYVYICENNTIYGTKYHTLPDTKGKPLVADVSSCFMSEKHDVRKYGVLWGGVQKNVGPAGLAIVTIRSDLIREDLDPKVPTIMNYHTTAEKNSLYNTPPCYTIYMCGLVFQWLKRMGGLDEMHRRNEAKAKLLYDYLDQSRIFHPTAEKDSRSLMNVTFVTDSKEMDAKFVKEAADEGMINLKGHRSVGGVRASIYNAMPEEGVRKLVEFMDRFEKANR